MRVARAHESLDERRQVVVDLLDFIRDFNKLDTTLIARRVMDDQKFLEAAEAVLLSAVGPWKSIDALRDFCVQNLMGEKPPASDHPRARVTPFSVPFAILRAMAPNPAQFNMHNLRTLNGVKAFQTGELVGADERWELGPNGSEVWLVTTMWAHVIPRGLKETDVIVVDIGANRILHEGKLWALVADAMPCFWWLPSHSPLEIKLKRQKHEESRDAILVIEGWRYTR